MEERSIAVSWQDHGLWRRLSLSAFLDGRLQIVWPGARVRPGTIAWIGWGAKSSGQRAQRLALRDQLLCFCLEDGFLRSVGLGGMDEPLSVSIDDIGVYYDATRPSRLEKLIAAANDTAQRERALALLAAWRASRISKYNAARGESGILPDCYVLVADQTFGDASIHYGLASPQSFHRMLQAALDEYPGCSVVLKIHPDVFAGKKRGNFDVAEVSRNPRVKVLAEDVHPVGLIEHAEAVYVVTSQMGFEGLLWGKRVRTFGMPFYAGWGLTEDELPAPERRKPVPLENLVHAALVEYPRYIDPETGKRCEVERVIEWMGLQRRMRERFPAEVYAVGFSRWKKPIVRSYFQGSTVKFVRRASKVPAGATVVVWGRGDFGSPHPNPLPGGEGTWRSPLPSPPPKGEGTGEHEVVRLEDGFLRSVGLGADLVAPLSWVMDRRGIYYDATRTSDLEHLLQTHAFDDAMRARAGRLRAAIVAHGLTKYNVGAGEWARPEWRTDCRSGHRPRLAAVGSSFEESRPEAAPTGAVVVGGESRPVAAPTGAVVVGGGSRPEAAPTGERRVILVPGQVENDASIRYGAADVRTNLGLLQAVRKANPDAYVVYKPHPDVRAGLRKAGAGEDEAARWCDEIVEDVPMQVMLDAVDEVHVITSLAGFEALLRGRKVTCYGNPFYAGWGLTHDMAPLARRTRRLSLDELVAGVLILYPTYISRTTGRFTTPERALEELLAWREQGASGMPLWRKGLRVILRALKLNG